MDVDVQKVDGDGLLAFDELLQIRNEFTVRRGVYFLWEGNVITYIGQSTNIHQRISAHFVDKFREWKIDGYSFIEVDNSYNLDTIEALYIAKFSPRHNRKK